MKFLYHTSLLILLITGACRPSETSPGKPAAKMDTTFFPAGSSSDYRQLAESKLGEKVSYAMNEAQTMVLCQKVENASTPAMINKVRFLVILLKSNTILYEDQIANAHVEWYNNTQLKINTFPGIVQVKPDMQKHYYLYDVVSKRKLPPPSNKY